MRYQWQRSAVALFLALAMLFSLTSCKKKPSEPEQVPAPVEVSDFLNALPMPDRPDASAKPLDLGLSHLAMDKYEQNQDTIGWLSVPGTTIHDPVLYYPDSNDKFHYLRRDFDGNNSWEGSYFADYRSHFEGGRDGMSRNTVIYGHSMEDDANYPLFSQLKKYRDPEFAAANPYVYFSTLEEDVAWQIFAVFVTTVDFSYNKPNPDDATFAKIIDGARSRSIYTYDEVEVTSEDKILTLSTCIYYVNGEYQKYPNNYRYVVMAKQLPAAEELVEIVPIAANATIAAP